MLSQRRPCLSSFENPIKPGLRAWPHSLFVEGPAVHVTPVSIVQDSRDFAEAPWAGQTAPTAPEQDRKASSVLPRLPGMFRRN